MVTKLIIETPLTKPSKPSIKLIALVMETIHRTVKNKVKKGPKTNNGPPKGILKLSNLKSVKAQTITAPIRIPNIFNLGLNSYKSSKNQ